MSLLDVLYRHGLRIPGQSHGAELPPITGTDLTPRTEDPDCMPDLSGAFPAHLTRACKIPLCPFSEATAQEIYAAGVRHGANITETRLRAEQAEQQAQG